jgi:hypothetical protein
MSEQATRQTALPAHFFQASDGALHDTRRESWASKPIRPVYNYTFGQITNTQQLRATLRAGDYAWPGGYPMYMITSDGAALHFACARSNFRLVSDSVRHQYSDGWCVQAVDINYENQDLYCDQCSQKIASAYGDD